MKVYTDSDDNMGRKKARLAENDLLLYGDPKICECKQSHKK